MGCTRLGMPAAWLIDDYLIFILPVDTSWPEEAYGGISTENRLRAARDRAALPTAPRAARGPDIDSTKIPDGPPYTAFLGNLSYDVDKEDILEFFGNKKVLWQLYIHVSYEDHEKWILFPLLQQVYLDS